MIKNAITLLTCITSIAFVELMFFGWAAGYDGFLQML